MFGGIVGDARPGCHSAHASSLNHSLEFHSSSFSLSLRSGGHHSRRPRHTHTRTTSADGGYFTAVIERDRVCLYQTYIDGIDALLAFVVRDHSLWPGVVHPRSARQWINGRLCCLGCCSSCICGCRCSSLCSTASTTAHAISQGSQAYFLTLSLDTAANQGTGVRLKVFLFSWFSRYLAAESPSSMGRARGPSSSESGSLINDRWNTAFSMSMLTATATGV